jgi:hypothetical protein
MIVMKFLFKLSLGFVGFVLLGAVTFVSAEEIMDPSPIMKAADIAYRDFSRKLAADFDNGTAQTKYLKNIENYEIKINRISLGYIIEFIPSIKQSDEIWLGGGAKYEISVNLEILSALRYK